MEVKIFVPQHKLEKSETSIYDAFGVISEVEKSFVALKMGSFGNF